MAEEKNIKYAGQLIDIARKSTRLVVDDMLRAMDEKDGDPFLGVFSKNSIYRLSILDFGGQQENGKKVETYLANIPLPDLAVIEEHTDMAERILFDISNGCGFEYIGQKMEQQTGLIKTLGKLFMRLKGGKEEPQQKPNEGQAGPLTDQELDLMKTNFWMGNLQGKSPYSIIMDNEDGKGLQTLESQKDYLSKNMERFSKNRKMVKAIELTIAAYKSGRLKKESGANQSITFNDGEEMKLEVYSSSMKYLSINYSDAMNRRRWYKIDVNCYPRKDYPYVVTITNHFANIKTTTTGLTQMDGENVVWGKPKTFKMTEAEWLHVVREMKDNRENARVCFYANARNQDVKRRFANRTQAAGLQQTAMA